MARAEATDGDLCASGASDIEWRDIEWIVAPEPVAYPDAVAWMDARSMAVARGLAREAVWLLEHPPLYTAGTSAAPAELLDARFPVHVSGRGGRYTYHGPGQRVGYLVLDLNKRGRDVRRFVEALETWLIATLGDLGITAWRAPGRVGIWTRDPRLGQAAAEAKIGAIGVRIRRWVTSHGFSINLAPELSHFDGIVACGLADFAVTSLAALGQTTSSAAFDAALSLRLGEFVSALGTNSCGLMNYPLEPPH